MTNRELHIEAKRMAKTAMIKEGIKGYVMKNMELLEYGYSIEEVCGFEMVLFDYVMFKDKKTGKEFQCFYGPKYYYDGHESLYFVQEYVA